MSGQSVKPGFYGKLPVRGDFLSRRLQNQFMEAWDRWLQAGLASARESLGEEWINYYLGSPVWRFAIERGVCGPDLIAGVLIPSVDRVGRYFPLTIAAELNAQAIRPADLLKSADAWYSAAETVVLSALDPELDLEAFDQRVEALDAPIAGASGLIDANASFGSDQWWVPIADPGSAMAGLMAWQQCLLDKQLCDASLWWTRGSNLIQPCLLVCRGMPDAIGFPAMLAGDWPERNWQVSLTRAETSEPSPDEENPNS